MTDVATSSPFIITILDSLKWQLSRAHHVIAFHSVKRPISSFPLLSAITSGDATDPEALLAELLTLERDSIEELHKLDDWGKSQRPQNSAGVFSLLLSPAIIARYFLP